MNKYPIPISCFIIFVVSSSLSQPNIDNDTTSILRDIEYCEKIYFVNPDSALIYANHALHQSKKIHYEIGEIKCLNLIGATYIVLQNYPVAIKIFTDVANISEKIGYTKGMVAADANLGYIFMLRLNYRTALVYFFRALNSYKISNDERNYLSILINICASYIDINVDSALIYGQQAYQLANKIKNLKDLAMASLYLGQIHEKIDQLDLAISYYRISLNNYGVVGDYYDQSTGYYLIANVFNKKNFIDSSIYYGSQALYLSQKHSFFYTVSTSSKLLADIYKNTNKDSALKFLYIHVVAKDSVFQTIKESEINIGLANERLRQYEIIQRETLKEEEINYNLKLLGISIFIMVFFISVIFVRKKGNKKLIILLGMLGLLMLFEFISMALHSVLEKITEHNPILIIIILIIVGSILVPFHRKLELFVVHRLTKRKMIKHTKTKNEIS